jgi:glycosyltransferase involved in cell wall biosynthesis
MNNCLYTTNDINYIVDIFDNKDFSIKGNISKFKDYALPLNIYNAFDNLAYLSDYIEENININQNYINDIIVVGLVDNAVPYINLSDIIVSYSINEVLPMNIIESFYCGKPVVSSNVGGICEMIDDKYNGYLFDVNDHDNCFSILCNLIEDENLRCDIGNNAKQKFFEKFDENIVREKFISLVKY